MKMARIKGNKDKCDRDDKDKMARLYVQQTEDGGGKIAS